MVGIVDRLPNKQVSNAVSHRLSFQLVVLIAACSFLSGCATTRQPTVEALPSPVVQPTQAEQVAELLPPPDLNAVQETVKRVFSDNAQIDTSRKPTFVAGDFNGDLSQDIAVVLKPVPERLTNLNEEFATWMLRDALAARESRGRLTVMADETLLAVIHGFGPKGWRDPEATQTYLLKNAVGAGMEARHPKDVAAGQGKPMPRLRGDVIGEVLRGTAGYLYYSGATYAWYDPKTFKDVERERGLVHGGPGK